MEYIIVTQLLAMFERRVSFESSYLEQFIFIISCYPIVIVIITILGS
jgi:hypothetical protein